MKHLLTGVAIAAALAIAAPAMAQNAPMTPSAPKAAAAAPAKAEPMKQRHHRMMRHHAMARRHHRGMAMRGESTTEQLNSQELQRVQGAAPMPMAQPPMAGPRAGPSH